MRLDSRLSALEANRLQLAIAETKANLIECDNLITACLQSWDSVVLPDGLAPDEYLFLVFDGEYEVPLNNKQWQAFANQHERLRDIVLGYNGTLSGDEIREYKQAIQRFLRE